MLRRSAWTWQRACSKSRWPDRNWRIVARHRFTRSPFERFLCTTPAAHVVMEACGTAHYWARLAQALATRERDMGDCGEESRCRR